MTNEEIDAEIARLTALKEQNNQTQTTENNKPADGIYNPADYIGQIANKMNKQSRNRGDQFSKSLEVIKDAGRRTGFEQDTDGTPLPETAYEWVVQQINEARARGPVNKYTLKAIENGAKVRYNVPGNFNISGPSGIVGFLNGSTERNMAKAINSMPYNGKTQKPAQPAQNPQTQGTQSTQGTQGTQSTQSTHGTQSTQQATKTEDKPKGKQVANSNKGVAGASVGDFIVRSDGSTHVITQADIDWAKKKTARQTQQVDSNTVRGTKDQMKADIANGNVKPTYNENSIIGATQEELDAMKAQGLSDDLYNKGMQAIKNGNGLNDDDMQFMDKYKQYTQQLSGSQPRSAAALKAMQESEAYKFVNDQANKERHNKLSQVQKDTKKVNKQTK